MKPFDFIRGLFASSAVTEPSSSRKRGGDSRRRRLAVERLEDRTMMTTTVFLDFGEGFNRNMLSTVVRLRDELFGPDAAFTVFADEQPLEFVSLRSQVASQQLDFDKVGGKGNDADYIALRNSIVSLVKRQFEPFDIKVEIAGARQPQDILNTMGRNAGDASGQFDAYVMVAGIFDAVTGVATGIQSGYLGIASALDLITNQANVTDETVILDGLFILQDAAQGGYGVDTSFATIISHEAGHSLGLRHTNAGSNLVGQGSIDQEMLTFSDIIGEGGGQFAPRLGTIPFFTRFDLLQGDGVGTNFGGGPDLNSYNFLVNDADIGPNPNFPEYITGTGAFDRINIARLDNTTARVTVEAHRNATFSSLIDTYAYDIEYAKGILIDSGRETDRIIIDAAINVPVRVRGGQGVDEIQIMGAVGSDASYVPGLTTVRGAAQEIWHSAVVNITSPFGQMKVTLEELDANSVVTLNTFDSVTFNGSVGADKLTVNRVLAGTNEVDGTLGTTAIPAMRFTNVPFALLLTDSGNDTVTIGAAGLAAAGLQSFGIFTSTGDDVIAYNATNLAPPVAGGSVAFDFGLGLDRLEVTADANLTLTDFSIASSVGGSIQLSNLKGETANLTGGAGANSFDVNGWTGKGKLTGGLGTDTAIAKTNGSIAYSEFLLQVINSVGPTMQMGSIEVVNLAGSAGPNTFIDQGWFGAGSLNGGAGIDSLTVTKNFNVTLSDTAVTSPGIVTLTSIESAFLQGGVGNNQFDVSTRTLPVTMNGGTGTDSVFASRDADFTLTNTSLKLTGASIFVLASIEKAVLTGGGGANTFNVTNWAGFGTLDGAAGDDTFNLGVGNLAVLNGRWTVIGGAGALDRLILNDTLAVGTANYLASPTEITNGTGTPRTFGGVTINGTLESVRINGNATANNFTVTPSLTTSFTFDGNGPSGLFGDSVTLRFGTTTGKLLTKGPAIGQGKWSFGSGHRDVFFEEIEQTKEIL